MACNFALPPPHRSRSYMCEFALNFYKVKGGYNEGEEVEMFDLLVCSPDKSRTRKTPKEEYNASSPGRCVRGGWGEVKDLVSELVLSCKGRARCKFVVR
eukprot:766262-Hanusia_phi.AAC.2